MLLKQMLLMTVFLGASMALVFYFIFQDSIRANSAPIGESAVAFAQQEESSGLPEPEREGNPVRLIIPMIDVDSAFEYVGLTFGGAMDVPKNPINVAWFNLGPRPGEEGSAVIAGHYGWKNNIPAAFDNLNKLRKGDKVYVEDEKGVVTAFVVRELRLYGEKESAANVFFSNDGKVHLNLITCQGVWNKNNKSYSSRLVVFTDKE